MPKAEILCCGESLIDMLPAKTEGGRPCFVPVVGGSVFNTAIALGRLQAPVHLFSGVSRDLFGRQLLDALLDSGVGTGFCVSSDRLTTLAFVSLDNGQASYEFFDENSAGRMVSRSDLPNLPSNISTLFFGGISLVVEPCAQAYEALMMREAARRLIMLDPNIRPGFISDEAAYRKRLDRLVARTDILKLSDEDLHWLKGPGAEADLVPLLLEAGPSVVMITHGAAGASAWSRQARVQVPSRVVDVVDTIGAGDTFNAGVIKSLHQEGLLHSGGLVEIGKKDVLARTLTFGCRAAAITVCRSGVAPPWQSELTDIAP